MTERIDAPQGEGRAAQIILLASVFLVATCGLFYELVMGAVSSYLLGDAVTQFSLVIGVFLCAMGVGSFAAKFLHSRLLEIFVEIEIWIGLVGGCSSMLMFAVNAFAADLFLIFFYTLCASLGILVGIEIPLLIRILKSGQRQRISEAVSHVLALDYIGALAASLLFPFVALPFLGLSRASVVFGLMNLGVAAAGMTLIAGRKVGMSIRLGLAAALLAAGFFSSASLVGFLEDRLYQDSVIYARDTAYQRIVLTRWQDDVRLFLNGHIQFSSVDEARYHEALVIPAMTAATKPRQVLILGGGDGLAAREVLKFSTVEQITVVDIDPEMTGLARTRPELVALNGGSLDDPRVRVVNADAMLFLRQDSSFYDVILADLPDPSTATLAKLYSRAFYALIGRRLALGGVMATQATSPFFAPKAFWCIVTTIDGAVNAQEVADLVAVPYHTHVPSFGEWGFVLAAHHTIKPEQLAVPVPTRFLTNDVLRGMFAFGLDMQAPQVDSNRLETPVLHRYYTSGWKHYNE